MSVGLYVFVIGLTGALLVFRPEMQARNYPQFFHAPNRGAPGAGTASFLKALIVADPGERVFALSLPTLFVTGSLMWWNRVIRRS